MLALHELRVARIQVLPMRAKGGVSPNMALGQMHERPALLIRIEDDQGAYGWGEIWANFPPRASLHKAHLVEDVVSEKLIGLSYSDPREAISALRKSLGTYFLHIGQLRVFEHVLAGIDLALWDLSLRSAQRTTTTHFELEANASAPVYASSVNPGKAEEMIRQHSDLGETFFKLKLGFGEAQDIAFVRDTKLLITGNSGFGVDPNQMWDVETAKRVIAEIEEFRPGFIEEPLPANSPKSDWEELAKWTNIPLAGGENLYGIDEFSQMIDNGLQYVQPDVAKWGGLSGALDLAKTLPNGVKLWPHFMGTAVGQVVANAVAAIIGGSSVAEMDVNNNVLRTDLCGPILTIADGRVELPDAPGLITPPLASQLTLYVDDRYRT